MHKLLKKKDVQYEIHDWERLVVSWIIFFSLSAARPGLGMEMQRNVKRVPA
jgi:hypothetical protein